MRKIRRWFISLALSIILWFFVTENNLVIDKKIIEIDYRGLPDNVIMTENLKKVTYTITKNPYYPNDIKPNVNLFVNITDTTPGWHNFPIEADVSPALPSYEHISLDVTKARVLLDDKSVKNVPIVPDIQVVHDSDFSIKNLRFTPTMTQIVGPEKILQNITSLPLGTIVVNQAGEFNLSKKILLPSSSIESQDSKVSVQFSVLPKFVVKDATISICAKNIPGNLTIDTLSLKKIHVQLRGLPSQFDNINSYIDSMICVDLSKASEPGDFGRQPLIFHLPDNMSIVSPRILPSVVDVVLKTADEGAASSLLGENNTPNDSTEPTGELNDESENSKTISGTKEKSPIIEQPTPPSDISSVQDEDKSPYKAENKMEKDKEKSDDNSNQDDE